MKITDKKKPVHTIPSGVWESSRPDKPEKRTRILTDLLLICRETVILSTGKRIKTLK